MPAQCEECREGKGYDEVVVIKCDLGCEHIICKTCKAIIQSKARMFDKTPSGAHQVVPCNAATFYDIDCLENETQYGFFKSESDIRPSSCTWIDKEKAEKLYSLFNDMENS